MTLSKAQEIIRLNLKKANKSMPPDVKDALILCTHSNAFILSARVTTPGSVPTLLEGETIG